MLFAVVLIRLASAGLRASPRWGRSSIATSSARALIPFLLGLGVFTFVLLIARLLKLIELVVNRGVPATNILRLFAYLMPAFLEVTVPMAMLLAILVAFGRLSADSEMIAMRSSGLSLYQLVPPVAIFVVLATPRDRRPGDLVRPAVGQPSLRTAAVGDRQNPRHGGL